MPKHSREIHAVFTWQQTGKWTCLVLTASSVNDVTVAGGRAFVDNGIKTGERSARVAWHAPEGVGGAGQQGCRGRKGCDGLHSADKVVRVRGRQWYCCSGQ